MRYGEWLTLISINHLLLYILLRVINIMIYSISIIISFVYILYINFTVNKHFEALSGDPLRVFQSKINQILWTKTHFNKTKCVAQISSEKYQIVFLYQNFKDYMKKQSDNKKLLNAQYSAFLRVSHFHIISVNEYHG